MHTGIRISENFLYLVSVVVAFFICYIPFHTQRILMTYNIISFDPQGGLQILYYVTGVKLW